MTFVRSSPDSISGEGVIVTAGDLTGAINSLNMDIRGLKRLMVTCEVTRPIAGVTAVQMFPEVIDEDGDPSPLQDKEETATPVKILAAEQEDKAIPGAGTTRWSTLLEVSAKTMRLRFTATAGAAGDLLDVFVYGTK